jgi:hypothetical protein
MGKVKLSVYTFFYATLFPSIVSLGFLASPLQSIAYVMRIPEVNYRNCARLQEDMNSHNRGRVYKGFERSELMRRGYDENAYIVYCNGGVIVNRVNGTICRGYIAYGYSPSVGESEYYGAWGWANGSSNSLDTGKERYCRRLK